MVACWPVFLRMKIQTGFGGGPSVGQKVVSYDYGSDFQQLFGKAKRQGLRGYC